MTAVAGEASGYLLNCLVRQRGERWKGLTLFQKYLLQLERTMLVALDVGVMKKLYICIVDQIAFQVFLYLDKIQRTSIPA